MKRSTKILPLILSALLITGCNSNKSDEPFDSEEPEISEQIGDSSQAPISRGQTTSRGGQTTSRGQTTTSKTSAPSIPAPAAGFAFDDTQLNQVQEIHTTNQKNYLNYSGEYYNITSSTLNGFGASGNLAYPASKYYQTYTTIDDCANGSCLGDALHETRSWYGDYAYFVSASYPWFGRGGSWSDGAGAGAFGFYLDLGGGYSLYSFRVFVVARSVA